jgi:hypothetical protein
VQPAIWDPSTGEQRLVAPVTVSAGSTHFEVVLPPVGSCFVVSSPQDAGHIVATNLTIDRFDERMVAGYGLASHGEVVVERGGKQVQLRAEAPDPQAGLPVLPSLEGAWEFTAEDANALVIERWLATPEVPGTPSGQYSASDADMQGWLPMTMGAWSYQLPAEPSESYPLPVWFRCSFVAEHKPSRLDLIVDGFAGAEWQIYVNGQLVTAAAERSTVDAQMKAVSIAGQVQEGPNVLSVRLVLTSATDGLLDLLKLTGDFSLRQHSDGSYVIAAPQHELQPASWAEQGYPFYSGRGVYRRRFTLASDLRGKRIFVHAPVVDDVLEVVVNGQYAGVCLWDPYQVEVTAWLREGENMLELRVANTLINLLQGVARPSGLCGAPQLAAYHEYELEVPTW